MLLTLQPYRAQPDSIFRESVFSGLFGTTADRRQYLSDRWPWPTVEEECYLESLKT